uniref:Uncharacterized protein n=1 Tax=viral metagenome TaxID=1070528 RepID=A0A6H1Z982_9ZZZZ
MPYPRDWEYKEAIPTEPSIFSRAVSRFGVNPESLARTVEQYGGSLPARAVRYLSEPTQAPQTLRQGAQYITQGMEEGGAIMPGPMAVGRIRAVRGLSHRNLYELAPEEYIALKKESLGGNITLQEERMLRDEHEMLVMKARERGLIGPEAQQMPKPTVEEIGKLQSGKGWVEFESDKGTIVQGKINDVFPMDKELWVFPSDRSLLPDPKMRQVLRVPFDRVTRILEVE